MHTHIYIYIIIFRALVGSNDGQSLFNILQGYCALKKRNIPFQMITSAFFSHMLIQYQHFAGCLPLLAAYIPIPASQSLFLMVKFPFSDH